MKNISPYLFITLIAMSFCPMTFAQFQAAQQIAKVSEVDEKTYTGILSEQYANGSPFYWKTLVNGKAEGLWLEWYPNGQLRFRAYWKNNKGHGKWEYFYPNGQLRSESFYINDIAQGMYRSFHKNGRLANESTYLDGKKEGLEFLYDANAILISRKRYENGIQLIDEPLLFQKGIISGDNSNEWNIQFMPDGNTAYFTRRNLTTGKKRIYITTKAKNGWTTPKIAPFSTDEDEAPFIGADGNKLFFASYRPLPDGSTSQEMDMNIWMMERVNNTWSSPTPLSKPINTSMKAGNSWPAHYEAGPATDREGNLYYWTKGLTNKATNIFMAKRQADGNYGSPTELLTLSSTRHYDTAPQLSRDGKLFFFSSDNRPSGYGDSDIYYSIKVGDTWSTPKNLGPIVNSSRSEGSPSFSPDGKYLYFSSNRGDQKDANGEAIWNIYYMETRFLLIK